MKRELINEHTPTVACLGCGDPTRHVCVYCKKFVCATCAPKTHDDLRCYLEWAPMPDTYQGVGFFVPGVTLYPAPALSPHPRQYRYTYVLGV